MGLFHFKVQVKSRIQEKMYTPIAIITLIMLLASVVNFLIILFLVWGLVFPKSSLRIEGDIRKRLFKRPVLIITADSARYIRYRNSRLLGWLGVIYTGLLIIFWLVFFMLRG